MKKSPVKALFKEIENEAEREEDAAVLKSWLKLEDSIAKLKRQLREGRDALEAEVEAKYADFPEDEVQDILINDKWLPALRGGLYAELARAVNGMEDRLLLLADRYASPLTKLEREVEDLSAKVAGHLTSMGLSWN